MNMTYDEAVEYIINVPRFNKYIDQKHVANATLIALMEELGNPQLKVKSIHIAGTNGKGSTVQLIKNILVGNGYRVGCFASPHLNRIKPSPFPSNAAFASVLSAEIWFLVADPSFAKSTDHQLGLSSLNNVAEINFITYS